MANKILFTISFGYSQPPISDAMLGYLQKHVSSKIRRKNFNDFIVHVESYQDDKTKNAATNKQTEGWNNYANQEGQPRDCIFPATASGVNLSPLVKICPDLQITIEGVAEFKSTLTIFLEKVKEWYIVYR